MAQYLDDDGNPITASPDVKLPPGYSLLSSKGSKKTNTPKKNVKELKAQAEKIKPIDYTSNPKNEGLYSMYGRTGTGDAVGELKVPYSKVQDALKSGSTFYNGSGEVYDKDNAAEGKPVSWYQNIIQSPALVSTPNEKPQAGSFSNLDKAAARMVLATPAYVKQLWDAAQSMHRGEVSGGDEFANLINPAQLPKQLYDQYQVDAKVDKKMAADNLLGSLAGLGVVGAVTHGATKAIASISEHGLAGHPINIISEHPVTGELNHSPQEVAAPSSAPDKPNAEPINAYHGTPAQFEGSPRTDGLGAHFTLDPELAKKFAEGSKGRVIEAKLGIKNPLRIDDHGGSHTYSGSTIEALVKQGHLPADEFDPDVIAERQTARHQELLEQAGVIDHTIPTGTPPSEAWKKANYDAWGKSNTEELERAKEYLKSKGYDGLVYDNKAEGHGDSYVAFDPHQISLVNGEPIPDVKVDNNQPLQKPLHEMSPAEIEEEHGKAQNRDKQDVIDIFGEEDAKKYNKLQRSANNSYDMKKADAAATELQEMEGKLTPEQQNKLYGISDTRHSLEDLKDYRDAYHGLDDSSPEALGDSLKWAVSQVGDPTRAPETMTSKERIRLAQLRYGYEDAVKNGYDPMAVMKAAVNSASERFKDPEDARLMLEDVVKALHIGEQETPPQNTLSDGMNTDAKGQETDDRRVDLEARKRVEDMTPEEMKKALLTSDVTGAPNRRAFDDAEHVSPSPAIGMSDADGLKALNDKFGYAAGNELLKAKADALKAAGLDAYHEKGDEFLYRGESPESLKEKLDKAREILRDRTIEVTLKDGKKLHFKGADFSYGTGKDLDESESGLKQHKQEREDRGERARGELRGITEVESEGSAEHPSDADLESSSKEEVDKSAYDELTQDLDEYGIFGDNLGSTEDYQKSGQKILGAITKHGITDEGALRILHEYAINLDDHSDGSRMVAKIAAQNMMDKEPRKLFAEIYNSVGRERSIPWQDMLSRDVEAGKFKNKENAKVAADVMKDIYRFFGKPVPGDLNLESGDKSLDAPKDLDKNTSDTGDNAGTSPNTVIPIQGGTHVAGSPVQDTVVPITNRPVAKVMPLSQVKIIAAELAPNHQVKNVRDLMQEAKARMGNSIVP